MEVFPLASCDTNCAAHYHKMNRDTDEKGVVLFEIYPATFKGGMFYEENRVVTLRALFDYPGKDKLNDPPILERKELFFAWEPQETVIKLEPGGGLDKKEEVLPPVQDQAPSEPSPSPKKEGGFSYAPLLVGGAFLVAGIIFIPMIIRSFSGRDR